LLAAGLSYALAAMVRAWPIPLGVFLVHLLLDWLYERRKANGWRPFALFHWMHIAAIAGLTLLAARILAAAPGLDPWSPFTGYDRALTIVGGLALSIFVGAEIVGRAVVPLKEEMERELAAGVTAMDPARPRRPRKGFEQGGRIIGMLERGIIFLLVLVESPTAIGFLIAAKSLLRFGDIGSGASRKEVEYILIGTLMSFLFGLTTSYLTLLAVGALQPAVVP